MLALHIVAAVPADPQVTPQVAVPLQLTRQSPLHVTVQLERHEMYERELHLHP